MMILQKLTRITASCLISLSILVSVPGATVFAFNGLSQDITADSSGESELVEVKSNDVEGFITRLYEIALGRSPDPAGLLNWVEQLTSRRATGVQVAYGFVFSPEFLSKNLSNTDYVECLYKMLLGRASDPSGKKSWVKQLDDGASREMVFAGFANSTEFRAICDSYRIIQGVYIPGVPLGSASAVTDFVLRLYTICLGRTGENGGISNWTRQLLDGSATGSGVAYGFVFSQEYLNKSPAAEDYITMLYRTFLGREPDQDGLDNWVSSILAGISMESVFAGFVNSQEFTEICGRYGISRGSYTPPSPVDSHYIGYNLFMCMVNGNPIAIGDSVDTLTSRFGEPDRIDPTEYPWAFYVYSKDYSRLFMAAVQDGKVVGWYTDSSDLEYMGLLKSSTGSEVKERFPDFDFSRGMSDCAIGQNYTLIVSLSPLKPGEKPEDLPSSGRVVFTGENELDTIMLLPQQNKSKQLTAEICRAYELEICDITNSFRSNEGCSVLSWSNPGAKAARLHSEDMAANNYFSHDSLNGDDYLDRLRKQGVTGLYPSGENIGAGYSDPFDMLFGWKTSNGHMRNLLYRDYTYIGVGVGYSEASDYKYYWTQDFHA